MSKNETALDSVSAVCCCRDKWYLRKLENVGCSTVGAAVSCRGLLLAYPHHHHPPPPPHPLWFCQSKCTSLAAKSSGHRPSGCSREMPIVLASTGPSQTAQEGTDGTNGRAESNRGTGTEPHRSAVQITVVWMYCMANAPLCSSGDDATAMRHKEFKMIK